MFYLDLFTYLDLSFPFFVPNILHNVFLSLILVFDNIFEFSNIVKESAFWFLLFSHAFCSTNYMFRSNEIRKYRIKRSLVTNNLLFILSYGIAILILYPYERNVIDGAQISLVGLFHISLHVFLRCMLQLLLSFISFFHAGPLTSYHITVGLPLVIFLIVLVLQTLFVFILSATFSCR